MNPVDHPMGGGEGRTSGGGHPQSPWGQLSKGFPTRKKSNPTNSQIVVRRNGRQLKKRSTDLTRYVSFRKKRFFCRSSPFQKGDYRTGQ
jgi:predicted amidohydrolase